jgi:hypothetical protein
VLVGTEKEDTTDEIVQAPHHLIQRMKEIEADSLINTGIDVCMREKGIPRRS